MPCPMSPGNPSRPPPQLHTPPWAGLNAVSTHLPTPGDTPLPVVTAGVRARPRAPSADPRWGRRHGPPPGTRPGPPEAVASKASTVSSRQATSACLLPALGCDPTSLSVAGPGLPPPLTSAPASPPQGRPVSCQGEPPPGTPASHAPGPRHTPHGGTRLCALLVAVSPAAPGRGPVPAAHARERRNSCTANGPPRPAPTSAPPFPTARGPGVTGLLR